MKTRTINTILGKKFDAFCESIKDAHVKELVKNNTIITGGSIVSMLLNEDVNDYDMYFRDRATTLAVAGYFTKIFKDNPPSTFKNYKKDIDISVIEDVNGRVKIVIKSAGVASETPANNYEYFEGIQDPNKQAQAVDAFLDKAIKNTSALDDESAAKLDDEKGKPKYRPVFLSSNAITLSDQVQCIVRFYGEPEEILKNYDFLHCTQYWTSWNRKVILSQEALECILAKELKYCGSLYPVCSVIRTRKFMARGWSINAGQYLKMCFQISKLDLSDIQVLEDQLIGVDAAYFTTLIDALKKHDKNNTGKLDAYYLVTVIDRLF